MCNYLDHQAAGGYPGFSSMKLGWHASPSQGYPKYYVCQDPIIRLSEERHFEINMSCTRTQHNIPRPGLKPGLLDPETSALSMRPQCDPTAPFWFASAACQMSFVKPWFGCC